MKKLIGGTHYASSLIIIALLLLAAPTWAQIATPTPSKTATAGPSPTLQPDSCHTDIQSQYRYNPQSYMTVSTLATAATRRAAIINYIWKGAGVPLGMPSAITTNVPSTVWPVVAGLSTPIAHVDRYTTTYLNGAGSFQRVGYHYFPSVTWNGRVVFIHQGHDTSFYNNSGLVPLMDALLATGNYVVLNWEPLYGDDAGPSGWRQCNRTAVDGVFPCSGSSVHDQFIPLESAGYSGLVVFVDAEIRELNYIVAQYRPSDIAATGLSGGGWTVTLWAAIDPRIIESYPVAGSHPQSLQLSPCYPTTSDYEQWILGPQTAQCTTAHVPFDCCTGAGTGSCTLTSSYEDEYLLGSFPWPRRQMQLLNQYDSCCFAGVTYLTYALPISIQAGQLDGSFQVLLDPNTSLHQVSSLSQNAILNDLAGIRVLDNNADYGFFSSGSWQNLSYNQIGFESGEAISANAANGVGSWTFRHLVPGTYRASISWPPTAGLGTNVPTTVLVGGIAVASTTVDETTLSPDLTDYSVGWRDIGAAVPVNATEATLQVTNAANANVRADVARLQLVAAYTPTTTPTNAPASWPTCTPPLGSPLGAMGSCPGGFACGPSPTPQRPS